MSSSGSSSQTSNQALWKGTADFQLDRRFVRQATYKSLTDQINCLANRLKYESVGAMLGLLTLSTVQLLVAIVLFCTAYFD